jgi:hypothetical protein
MPGVLAEAGFNEAGFFIAPSMQLQRNASGIISNVYFSREGLFRVIYRQTQSSDYWSSFALTQDDAEFLYGQVLEAGSPKRLADLTQVVMRQRIDQENARLRRQFTSDKFYQPKKNYEVGEEVIFPALKFATGRVTAVRQGQNPDLGEFAVISVEMAGGFKREFAACFSRHHILNEQDPTTLMDEGRIATPDELYEQHGGQVAEAVGMALEQNSEFIRVGEEWFLRAMMADVNVGHLNLAEAVLDMASGGPLTTDVILRDLGLPPDVAGNVQEASLNAALAADERFDEVSLDDTPAWFLRRLEPNEVRETPAPLKPARFGGNTTLSEELETLARELDDELEFGDAPVEPADRASFILTYPHKRAGTLGWSRRVASALPEFSKPRVPIRLKDRASGKEATVWLVRDGRYLWGLTEWFRSTDIQPGSQVDLARGDGVWTIDFHRHKPRREWVRVASVREGRLHLETAQRAVTGDVDDLQSVFVDDARAFDVLRDRPRDVAQAVREAFPEIAKLSPQGNVHARSLYAVVNVIVRAAPRDVFSALVASGAYIPVGDNYWHLGDR